MLAAGADPNAELDNGMTPFLYLVGSASPEALDAFLDAGANLRATDSQGKGVLDYAKRNRPAARRLLQERMGIADSAIDRVLALI